jgi:hypothetical protein
MSFKIQQNIIPKCLWKIFNKAENLLGEFQELNPKGVGVLRPDDIPIAMSTTALFTRRKAYPEGSVRRKL